MEKLLSGKESKWSNGGAPTDAAPCDAVSGRTALKALGLQVGDRVVVKNSDSGGQKTGTLRFCGTTDFAPGVWAGVALDRAEGKNDGAVRGVVYFRCAQGHGVFVQAGRVAKVGSKVVSQPKPRNNVVNHGKVDTSHVSSRLTECLDIIEDKQEASVTYYGKILIA